MKINAFSLWHDLISKVPALPFAHPREQRQKSMRNLFKLLVSLCEHEVSHSIGFIRAISKANSRLLFQAYYKLTVECWAKINAKLFNLMS
jgi:hypothetical protein